ncbi:hypothetical protein HDU86_004792 [Geranomyces michiganensis]|nr:hypothetical protein HDU86_004792 [Geranomyces michiganensis]
MVDSAADARTAAASPSVSMADGAAIARTAAAPPSASMADSGTVARTAAARVSVSTADGAANARTAAARKSASMADSAAIARTAAAPPSASTADSGTIARTAAARVSASTAEGGTIARPAAARVSVSTADGAANARTAAARKSASTAEGGTIARTAAARVSVSTTSKEALVVPTSKRRSLYDMSRPEMKVNAQLAQSFPQTYAIGTYAPFRACGDLKRPDTVVKIDDLLAIVETDEDAHCEYEISCEWAKALQHGQSALQTEGVKRVCFVRFNPSAWHVDGKLRRYPLRNRLDDLDQQEDLVMFKMFYPGPTLESLDRVSKEELNQWLDMLSGRMVTVDVPDLDADGAT